MAYAILGNVPPIVGIYMAFFPVLVYFFLGTSKHNSMGMYVKRRFYFYEMYQRSWKRKWKSDALWWYNP